MNGKSMERNCKVIQEMDLPLVTAQSKSAYQFQEEDEEEEGWHVVTGRQKSSRADYSLDNLSSGIVNEQFYNNNFNGSFYSPIRNRKTNPFLSGNSITSSEGRVGMTEVNVNNFVGESVTESRKENPVLENAGHSLQLGDRIKKYKGKRHSLGKTLSEFLEKGINLETISDDNFNPLSASDEKINPKVGSKSDLSHLVSFTIEQKRSNLVSAHNESAGYDENKNVLPSRLQKSSKPFKEDALCASQRNMFSANPIIISSKRDFQETYCRRPESSSVSSSKTANDSHHSCQQKKKCRRSPRTPPSLSPREASVTWTNLHEVLAPLLLRAATSIVKHRVKGLNGIVSSHPFSCCQSSRHRPCCGYSSTKNVDQSSSFAFEDDGQKQNLKALEKNKMPPCACAVHVLLIQVVILSSFLSPQN